MPAKPATQSITSISNEVPSHENPNNEIESSIVLDTKKTEDIPTYVNKTRQETEKTINNDSEWQKPISLKALKKKLNEKFAIKYGHFI